MTPNVLVIGAGMIVHDQLLPSLFHLQRQGRVGEITVCGTRASSIQALREASDLKEAFPGQTFRGMPDASHGEGAHPELYRDALSSMREGDVAVIAIPDALHYGVQMQVIAHGLHSCMVKPLALTNQHAEEIAKAAHARGVFIGVEYHKRFDDRALMARRIYRQGRFGDFRLAQAQMHEPWFYRDSNFQNWFTCEHSDMFAYVGCHYVDQIAFITGLRPVRVSVYGQRDAFPNGHEGFLWTDARVIWENGGCLNVVNCMGSPNAAAGGNYQGLAMWGHGGSDGTMLVHSDQYRGLKHTYTEASGGPGGTVHAEPNPDYFQLVDRGGAGLTPVGYGYRSVEAIVQACIDCAAQGALEARQQFIEARDQEGILATPANSSYNELVIEAGRLSILNDGREALIDHGPPASVRLRNYN